MTKSETNSVREAIARALAPHWFGIVDSAGEVCVSNYPGQTAKYQASAYEEADRILAAIEAAGWQCVPKEPDVKSDLYNEIQYLNIGNDGWARLLAAAPKPREREKGKQSWQQD